MTSGGFFSRAKVMGLVLVLVHVDLGGGLVGYSASHSELFWAGCAGKYVDVSAN